MATTSVVLQENSAEPVKLPLVSLVLAIALGVIVSVSVIGGVGYYLIHSGKLKLQTAPAVQAVTPTAAKTHAVVLEPLLVNLADGSGGAYLRISIALNLADGKSESAKDENKSEDAKAGKEIDAAIRDTALTVLGRETSESLLAADGKERLKNELRAALAEHNPEIKVMDLFFTEFLVQR